MKKMTRGRCTVFVLFTVLAVLWMCAIFGFSSKNADESTVQSNAVTEFLLSLFEKDFNDLDEDRQLEIIEMYDGIVRKCAHFAAYALLGFLTYISVGSYKHLPDKKHLPCIVSIPVCVVFSISDELHQTFVDGRSGQLSDVLVDSSGAVFGTLFAIIAVYAVFGCIKKYKKT